MKRECKMASKVSINDRLYKVFYQLPECSETAQRYWDPNVLRDLKRCQFVMDSMLSRYFRGQDPKGAPKSTNEKVKNTSQSRRPDSSPWRASSAGTGPRSPRICGGRKWGLAAACARDAACEAPNGNRPSHSSPLGLTIAR